MKITFSLRDLIYICVIIILLWLAFRNTKVDNQEEVKRLTSQRDSILTSQIAEKKALGDNYHKLADSCLNAVNEYKRIDSLIHIKYKNEKAKVPRYTNSQRNHALDSLFASHNVR
jgi:hypothetical protein